MWAEVIGKILTLPVGFKYRESLSRSIDIVFLIELYMAFNAERASQMPHQKKSLLIIS